MPRTTTPGLPHRGPDMAAGWCAVTIATTNKIRISYLFFSRSTLSKRSSHRKIRSRPSGSALEGLHVEDQFAHPEEPTATSLQPIQHLGRVFSWSNAFRKMDSSLRGLRFRCIHGGVFLAECAARLQTSRGESPRVAQSDLHRQPIYLVLANGAASQSISRAHGRGGPGSRVAHAERWVGVTVSTIDRNMEEIMSAECDIHVE